MKKHSENENNNFRTNKLEIVENIATGNEGKRRKEVVKKSRSVINLENTNTHRVDEYMPLIVWLIRNDKKRVKTLGTYAKHRELIF